jgi:transketolase
MVGMGIGLAAKGYIPFMATFAAFLSRAHDQIRMASYSMSNLKFVGSHVGTSIGADGPSQMGLEDLAIFTPIPGCAVLYPSDAYSSEACVESMVRYKGMAYLRTTRPGTPILYDKKEKFPVGGSKVIRKSSKDRAIIIAAGITVLEALKAYEELKQDGIAVRIIDAYSIQPLDSENMVGLALAGKAEIVHLAVRDLPRSGKPGELMDKYGISKPHIMAAVRSLIS